MKHPRKLVLIMAVMLSLMLAVGGTMAYLQDTDEDVNVMTLGSVHIKQLEYERVPEDGHEATNDAWDSTGETDKYGYTPDQIREFKQDKPLYPAVFADGVIKWDERADNTHQQSWADVKGEKTTGAPGSNQLFDDSVKNAIDKFVFVENTGKSDAYVRTWFAFEQGALTDDEFSTYIGTSADDIHWEWETVDSGVKIAHEDFGESTYVIACATYKGPTSEPNGILSAGKITYPSLLQVYMHPTAGNDVMEKVDGNQNGKYDILVVSQAVQAEGFADAETALEEAFGGETVETSKEVFKTVKGPIIVYNTEELRAAMKLDNVEIFLGDDLIVDDDKGTGYCYYAKYNNVINLNGHDITVDLPGKTFNGIFYALNGAQLDIVGEGNVTIEGGVGQFIWCTGAAGDTQVNIYGGNWTQNSPDFENDYCEGLYANRTGEINIYGGTYNWSNWEKYTANESREGVVNVYGGSFVNFDPQVSHDSDGSYVADGYKVQSETQDNGDTLYTVVKE